MTGALASRPGPGQSGRPAIRSAAERIICWTATQNGGRVRLRHLGNGKNDAWTCLPEGMVFIDPAGLHGQALRQWIDAAAGYVRGLPSLADRPPR